MKRKEMIELVQLHHPNMGETQIVKLLDRAKDDFCAKTELVKTGFNFDITSGQKYYDAISLADLISGQKLIKISEVWIDKVKIPRLIHPPIIEDSDEPTF